MFTLHPALRPDLLSHPLMYAWSAEGQKLYAWLRLRLEHDRLRPSGMLLPEDQAPGAIPPAGDRDATDAAAEVLRAWHGRGYLATYATAEQIMDSVLDVSRNTVTKLIGELRDRKVCVPRRVRRGGHVFLLGEWGTRSSPMLDADLYWQCFYLDGLLEAELVPGPAGGRAVRAEDGDGQRRGSSLDADDEGQRR